MVNGPIKSKRSGYLRRNPRSESDDALDKQTQTMSTLLSALDASAKSHQAVNESNQGEQLGEERGHTVHEDVTGLVGEQLQAPITPTETESPALGMTSPEPASAAPEKTNVASSVIIFPTSNGQRIAVSIAVTLIDPSPYQPRVLFDPDALESLADNLREIGLRSPIEVRPKGDRFELVAGERRLRATKMNGDAFIQAFVENISDNEAFKRVGAENLARENLSAWETAQFLKGLLERNLARNNSELARLSGKSRGDVIRYLKFFELPAEAIRLIQANPEKFGTHVPTVLAKFAEHHPDLVIKATQKIIDGMEQSKIEGWFNAQLAHRPINESRREFTRSNGDRFAVVSATTKGISIKLSDTALNEELIESIYKLIEERACEKNSSQD
jgi:ParB family chromosome partitioning protein